MEPLKQLIADGGVKSRKLWFGVGCVFVLAGMVFAACHFAVVVGLYSQLVTGVVALYSIYCGGDVVRHLGNVKHLGDKLTGADEDKPDADGK